MKLDRIELEISKVRAKISDWQGKLKELEDEREEAENLQIVQLVRSYKLNHAELEAFLRSKQPVQKSVAAAALPITSTKPMTPPINPVHKEDKPDDKN